MILTIGLSLIAGNMSGTATKKVPTKQELEREIVIKDSLHSEIKIRMDILKYRYNHNKK